MTYLPKKDVTVLATGIVTHTNPQDFTVAFTSNVTITVTGAPFVVADANCRIVYIKYKPTASGWKEPLRNGQVLEDQVLPVSITAAAGVITVANAGTPFVAGDLYEVGIVHQKKAYNKTTLANNSDTTHVAGTATDVNSGNKGAGSQRVVVATDDVNLSAIKTATEASTVDLAAIEIINTAIQTAVELLSNPPLPATHRGGVAQDFAVAFTSDVTVTCAGAPFTVDDANCFVSYIYYRPTGGSWQVPIVNGVAGASITAAADVITVAGVTTPFAASDEYLVGVIYQKKGHDSSLDVEKVIVQAYTPKPVTDLEAYTTFTPPDAVTYVEGTVLDVQAAEAVVLYYSKTASAADNNYIRASGLATAVSAIDYQQTSQGSPVGGVQAISKNIYEIDKAAAVDYILIPTGGVPYMRLDMIKVTDTPGDDATFTTFINKIPR